jgi:hypothetical protein
MQVDVLGHPFMHALAWLSQNCVHVRVPPTSTGQVWRPAHVQTEVVQSSVTELSKLKFPHSSRTVVTSTEDE